MKRLLAIAFSACACSLAACTGSTPAPDVTKPRALDTRIDVADTSIAVPDEWSYLVTRQAPNSWAFRLGARSAFNTGDLCDRQTGALGPLLRHQKAFVVGYAYRSELPKAAARYQQTPGSFRLERDTFAAYETIGCRPTYRIDFGRDGYYFIVHIALAKSAGGAIEREVLDVLNSIAQEAVEL